MPNITIYLDAETEQTVTEGAKASGLSKSKWIARAVKQHANNEWPDSWLDLAGSYPDFPLREDITLEGQGTDTKRIGF